MKKEKKDQKTYFGIFNSRDLYDSEVVAEIRAALAECRECDESEISDEDVSEDLWSCLDCEKDNLDKETGRYIIAIADLGFWYGRRSGVKKMGTNIKDIFNFHDYYDYEWYADLYDVHCNLYHHDGTHHLTFRCVKDKDVAESIFDRLERGESLSNEYLMKNSSSLRPYIAKIYGWKNFHHSKKRDSQPAK